MTALAGERIALAPAAAWRRRHRRGGGGTGVAAQACRGCSAPPAYRSSFAVQLLIAHIEGTAAKFLSSHSSVARPRRRGKHSGISSHVSRSSPNWQKGRWTRALSRERSQPALPASRWPLLLSLASALHARRSAACRQPLAAAA